MSENPDFQSNSADIPPLSDTAIPKSKFVFLDIVIQLLSNKKLIFRIVMTFIVLGVLVCLVVPRRYTATAKIMPPQQTQSGAALLMNQLLGSSTGSMAALAAGGSGLSLKNPNDIYIGILESRSIADVIIGKFSLLRLYRSKDMTEARKELENNTEILSEKSGVLSISVTDKDKKRAADITNTYIDELRTLTNAMSSREAENRLRFYTELLEDHKQKLMEAEERFKEVEQQKKILHPDAQARGLYAQMAEIKARISVKEMQISALKNYSTNENPEVRQVSSELASLHQQLEKIQQQSLGGEGGPASGDIPEANLAYLNAEHEVRYRQTMVDLLTRQYDAATLDVSKDAAVIQVLDPAVSPDRKSSPQVGILMLLFALIGVLGSCGWVILMWQTVEVRSSKAYGEKMQSIRKSLWRGKV